MAILCQVADAIVYCPICRQSLCIECDAIMHLAEVDEADLGLGLGLRLGSGLGLGT